MKESPIGLLIKNILITEIFRLLHQSPENHSWNNTNVNYDVKMGTFSTTTGASNGDSYDANGNIKKMQQWGLTIGSSAQIDNMTYSYFTNSNKLQAVSEQNPGTDYKLGDFTDKNTGSTDYDYDATNNKLKKVTVSPHRSNSAYESGELFSSDVGIKIYDGAKSPTDNVGTHIGLVRKGTMDHFSEAVDGYIFGNAVNIGLRSADRVKRSQEKK